MRMGKPIEITRLEFSANELRELAAGMHDGAVVRRLLAIALILDGHSRAEAARLNGMDRQTLRDWVHRYNDEGVGGLRARREITASGRLLVRRDGIVPLAVEIVARDVDRLHLSFSDLEAFGVEVSIDFSANFETCFGARRADELNDDLMTDQRLAPPVHGDEGEQAMLDLVPFAGARRQVGDADCGSPSVAMSTGHRGWRHRSAPQAPPANSAGAQPRSYVPHRAGGSGRQSRSSTSGALGCHD